MNRYPIRDLLALSADDLWALPEERHIVVFDDGDLETHTRATIASVYHLYPFIHFPEAQIRKEMHYNDRRFTSKRQLDLLNLVIWEIHRASGETVDPERLAQLAFETINRIYNDFTTRLPAYVSTLSMFDLLEVMYHPKIKAANDAVEPTQYSIEEVTYKKIREVFDDPAELRGNPMVEAVRSGTLKMDQVLQCIGPRGYLTDINSDIFPEPITVGYAAGMPDLYANLIESRTGSKSLIYNRELLRDTEYFNRRTQLVSQYVQRLHPGDCGTPHTIRFPVLEQLLPQLDGKYYVTEQGELRYLTGKETELIGQYINMRSVLGCIHPDPAGICSVCYGRLAFSIPRGTNLGQVSAVSVGDKITSSVLSTKHLDSSSRVEKFQLHKTEARYLRFGKEKETLYLRRDLRGKSVKLIVDHREVHNLADVLMLTNLDGYPLENASQLTTMQIVVNEGKPDQQSDLLRVSLYNRKSSFSRKLLEHIRRKRWVRNSRNNVEIDLTGFDFEAPLLTLPFRHVNMYEVMRQLQSFLHSGSGNDKRALGEQAVSRNNRNMKIYLRSYKDPVEALVTFTNMLNEKLRINVVHSEILLYAMMVRSSAQRDYRLPKPGISGTFERYSTLIFNRSQASGMAYQNQERPFNNPGSYIYTNRPDHPYDLLLTGGRQ